MNLKNIKVFFGDAKKKDTKKKNPAPELEIPAKKDLVKIDPAQERNATEKIIPEVKKEVNNDVEKE